MANDNFKTVACPDSKMRDEVSTLMFCICESLRVFPHLLLDNGVHVFLKLLSVALLPKSSYLPSCFALKAHRPIRDVSLTCVHITSTEMQSSSTLSWDMTVEALLVLLRIANSCHGMKTSKERNICEDISTNK